MEEEQEQRDAELEVHEAEEEGPGLFQFGPAASTEQEAEEENKSPFPWRERSPSPTLADVTRVLRRKVGGSHSDDDSDASVGSLNARMEFAFREEKHSSSKKRKRAPPKRKSPPAGKRPRAEEPRDEGEAVRDELAAMYEGKAAGVVADEDEEPEPMPADVVDWAKVEAEEPDRNPDPDWCALCKFTQRVIDVGDNNPYIPDLIKHAEDNWVHTDHVELMRQLQEKYNTEIRWSIEQVDQRLPWHKKTIFAHFTRHSKSTRIKYEAESQACDEMIFTMIQEELFFRNKRTGRKNVNLKKLPQWFKLLAQQERFEKLLKTLRPHNVL